MGLTALPGAIGKGGASIRVWDSSGWEEPQEVSAPNSCSQQGQLQDLTGLYLGGIPDPTMHSWSSGVFLMVMSPLPVPTGSEGGEQLPEELLPCVP